MPTPMPTPKAIFLSVDDSDERDFCVCAAEPVDTTEDDVVVFDMVDVGEEEVVVRVDVIIMLTLLATTANGDRVVDEADDKDVVCKEEVVIDVIVAITLVTDDAIVVDVVDIFFTGKTGVLVGKAGQLSPVPSNDILELCIDEGVLKLSKEKRGGAPGLFELEFVAVEEFDNVLFDHLG